MRGDITKFRVIHHDCDRDSHNFSVFGPFESEDKALEWIERSGHDMPMDGGYVINAVIQGRLR